jgi:hypothetical protein
VVELLLLYRLKPGVAFEEYRAWSLERDQPVTGRRDGVQSFRVLAVESPNDTGAYDVAELIEVAEWATWERITKGEPNVTIGREFAELVDLDSVVTLAGTAITP